MSRIAFHDYKTFPNDEFIKEMVYLIIDGKYQVGYIRKTTKNGNSFWAPPSISVSENGVKTYYDSFIQDSRILENEILEYLKNRKWETPVDQGYGFCC
jgi:hypothetical protein